MRVGIVGCSVIGAYLGWKLAKDHDVTIFEKRNVPGKDVCSGIVSERIWKHIPKNDEIIDNKISKIAVSFPKKTVKLRLSPGMFVVDRHELNQYVAELAGKEGAKILLNTAVESIREEKDAVIVKTKKGGHEFDCLIGCDGSLSVVRRSLGIKDPEFRLGILFYDSKKDDSCTALAYATRTGFFWKVPRGSYSEYGIVEKPEIAKKLLEEFCRKNALSPKEFHAALIPNSIVTTNSDRIALCGDAAAITKPWSLGGILWGLVAADLLLESFPNIKKYNKKLKNKFGPRMAFSKIATMLAVGMGFRVPQLLPKEVNFDSDWIL